MRNIKQRCVLRCAIILSFCYLTSVIVVAQNPRGSLQGEVHDPTGARVSAATVTVTDPAISVERTAKTNSRGEFRIDDLTPGSYHIVVKAAGFADASADAKVVVASVRDYGHSAQTAGSSAECERTRWSVIDYYTVIRYDPNRAAGNRDVAGLA